MRHERAEAAVLRIPDGNQQHRVLLHVHQFPVDVVQTETVRLRGELKLPGAAGQPCGQIFREAETVVRVHDGGDAEHLELFFLLEGI